MKDSRLLNCTVYTLLYKKESCHLSNFYLLSFRDTLINREIRSTTIEQTLLGIDAPRSVRSVIIINEILVGLNTLYQFVSNNQAVLCMVEESSRVF